MDQPKKAAREALGRGDAPQALAHLKLFADQEDDPEIFHLIGCAAELMALTANLPEQRHAYFEQAFASHQQALRQGYGWRSQVRIGTVELLTNDPKRALSSFEGAHQTNPESREAKLGIAEAHLSLHNLAAVKEKPTNAGLNELTQSLAGLLDERPDGWLLCAACAEVNNQIPQLIQLVAKTESLVRAGFVAPHRIERLHDLRALCSIYQSNPQVGPGPVGQLAKLMRSEYEPVKGGVARSSNPDMVKRVLRYLLLNGQTQWLPALLAPDADTIIPGLGDAIHGALTNLVGAH